VNDHVSDDHISDDYICDDTQGPSPTCLFRISAIWAAAAALLGSSESTCHPLPSLMQSSLTRSSLTRIEVWSL
jgi:hypothetical protein